MKMLWLILLVGCAPSPYKVGLKAARDGRYTEATTTWMAALDDDVYASKPRKGLREYGRAAWDQQLSLAREHEASARYAESVKTYEAMLAYADELDELELLSFPTADATTERSSVMDAWALAELAQGRLAHEGGRWQDATEHFDTVRELRPDTSGLDADQGASYGAWAREDVVQHRYADASNHYKAAYELTGDRSQDAWYSAIEVGLARYALERGACRAAVGHFEKAGDVVGDAQASVDRARALDCARVGLMLGPVADSIEWDDGELQLGSMLLGRIERNVEAEGSRFVRILAPELLATLDSPPKRQFRVDVRVSQASVSDPTTAVEPQTVTGVRLAPCDEGTALYSPDEVCTAPVEVEYDLHRTSRTVHLAGAVKSVDLSEGDQRTRPLDVQLTHDTSHATSFTLFENGTRLPVEIGNTALPGRIELPEPIVALDRPQRPLPEASEMLVDAVHALAEEAGRAILEMVDSEETLPPPRRLDLLEPLTDPSQMQFSPVGPAVEPDPPPVMVSEPLEAPSELLPSVDELLKED